MKDAEKQVADAKKAANSAKEQVRDAEAYLKGVESKWEVIDVDEDEADSNNGGDNNRLKEGKKGGGSNETETDGSSSENEFSIRRSRVVDNNNNSESAPRNRRGRSIDGGIDFSSEGRRVRSRAILASTFGVIIDKPTNPKAKDLVDAWRDKFGRNDDDDQDMNIDRVNQRSRGKDKKNFRGANHSNSYAHPPDTRMVRRDRQQRGHSRRQEQGGRVFYSGSDDPLERPADMLDQAESQQAANRPARSGEVAIELPRRKQSYTKSMGGFMSKLTSGNASVTSKRNRRKNKHEEEKREQCARAAIRRSDSMDSSSSEDEHKLSSGEKRKPQYDDRQSSNKRRSRDESQHDANDVDIYDDDEIMNAVSATSGQQYTPPPQSSISRADLTLNTTSFGLTKNPASSRSKTSCCIIYFQPILQH